MGNEMVKLLESGVLLRFDRTLEETLQHIVDAARVVIGAKYAALAVLDEGRQLSQFFYSGLSEEEAKRIGEPPKGRGVLGLIIEEGKPLRLRDVTKHPKAYGFPPHHPVMRSFLGVPIIVNGKPFGRLYLAEKIGRRAFTERDEKLALLLAAQAAATIERAMLAEQANRTERLELLNELVSKLNRLTDEKSVLETATEGIHASLPFAEVATVLYRPDESLSLLCFPEGSRLGLQLRRPCLKVNRTPFAVCMQERKSVILSDISVEKAKTPFERWLARRGFRSLIAVPVALSEQVLGVIFAAAMHPDAFSRDDLTFLQTVSDHVAVALANARLLQELREKERVRGLLLNKVVTAQEEERKRISHELHDQIGQLLTALLIQLQLLERDLNEPPLKDRVKMLKQLAEEISIHLHHIAWELRPPALDELGLLAALERVTEEWSRRFNIPCEFEVNGALNGQFEPEVAIGVFRIVQESLTNIAKHAKATHARVTVQQENGELVVTVEDNGIGFRVKDIMRHPDENKRLGLLGMMERAAMLSGKLDIESKPGKGTKVQLRIPLTKGWYRQFRASLKES
ncbi:GAF domain-containing sensor histidine kinase [Fervidibacter sacchari]|uniref:Signal transduction histidine kinase n=1 Tax=Candidatus Fervidibacter sacchari TaxID=1448929 RepID=A0ABT2EJF7_9BACT|nr:GAF domain-containing sensor histidine kinase [Candidatus Fervidibacter sacchari]MCS3918078.1 signal transduction histidine kinase [Candidatus Fervidibacter sacchari]WKU15887.1 GAF domain-containing sensor histidine kinase [Candidatus Fervidibacter sacchari]